MTRSNIMSNKGYLICYDCGGYYPLQEGESPEDFEDKCECGGQITYRENLDDDGEKDLNGSGMSCPDCGVPNPSDSRFCLKCGKPLQKSGISDDDIDPMAQETLKNDIKKWGLGLIAIGTIQIISFGFLDQFWGVLLILAGLLSLIVTHRAMYLLYGAIIIFAGLGNMLGGGAWTLFSFLQLGIGAKQFYTYNKWRKILG